MLLITAALVSIDSAGPAETYIEFVDSTYVVSDTLKCRYWITSKTGRRHNPKCGRYKKTRGYCTEDSIGIACKWCGG